MHIFVTATDTEVGKTYISALLARHFSDANKRTVALKPISCGDRHDAEILAAAAQSGRSLDEINPVHFALPAAPYRAGRVDFPELVDHLQRVATDFEAVVVEGVGGWLVPLTREQTVEDLARAMGYPVLLVVGNRLGAINQTFLTLAQIERSGLPLAGVVLNNFQASSPEVGNREMLQDFLGDRFWGEIFFGATALPPEIVERLTAPTP